MNAGRILLASLAGGAATNLAMLATFRAEALVIAAIL
jgi:hypothetical protein